MQTRRELLKTLGVVGSTFVVLTLTPEKARAQGSWQPNNHQSSQQLQGLYNPHVPGTWLWRCRQAEIEARQDSLNFHLE